MKYLFPVFLVSFLLGNNPSSGQFNKIERNAGVSETGFRKDLFIKPLAFQRKRLQRAVAAPLILTAAGLYSFTDNDLLNRSDLQEERNEWLPRFRHRTDDYLQYAPIAAVYGLNLMGIKGKNDFINRSVILIKSELLVAMLTFSLKKITAVPRPDTGRPTSFPSGHTAQAFAAATFMAKEYGGASIWYSVGAFTVASGIGAMRVMNNRHWISDVLVGAGVGILSTNLAYLTHRYKWGKNTKSRQALIIPSYDGYTGMVNVIYKL